MLRGHVLGVNSIVFSGDGGRLVSGSSDNTVRVWEVSSGTMVAGFSRNISAVKSLAFSPDGEPLQSNSLERRVERLKRREDSLATLRQDLDRVHAQALEMCIAAQRAFEQISSGADRAALADSVNRVRDLADEYYATQNEELAEKRSQLEDIRRQLAEENRQLQDREKQIRQWVRQRELTIERRAAQIASREAKLRRQAGAENRV